MPGFAGLGLFHHGDQVRQLGVRPDLVRADHQPAGQHDRAAGDRVALGRVDRDRLAGHHAAVHGGPAGQDLAVRGDPLPRPDHETLPGGQQADRDPLLGAVVAEHAHVPGPGRGQVTHGLPGGAPGPGLVEPAGQQERGHRGGHLQVDPAAGAVPQVLQAAQCGPAAVQHEHRVHRPAAGGQDAQRHQRVHGGGPVPGVPQRGQVERPGRPGRHRQGQRDQAPLPAGEPGPGEQREHDGCIGQRDEEDQRQDQPAAQAPDSGVIGCRTAVGGLVIGGRCGTGSGRCGQFGGVAGRRHDADEVGGGRPGRGGDAGPPGGEVDGGGDALELVQLALDPGRASGAGHAADDELERGVRAGHRRVRHL